MADTVGTLLMEVAQALAPLRLAGSSPQALSDFFVALGWQLPDRTRALTTTVDDLGTVIDKVLVIAQSTEDEQRDLETMLPRYADMVMALQELLVRLPDLPSEMALTDDFVSSAHLGERLPTRLIDFLIMKYLEQRSCVAYAVLVFLGFFELQRHTAGEGPHEADHLRHVVRLDRFGMLFSDGASLPADVYGWGTLDFDIGKFQTNLAGVFRSLGASLRALELTRAAEERLLGRSVPEADASPTAIEMASLYRGLSSGIDADVGVGIFGLRSSAPRAGDAGFAATPYANVAINEALQLSSEFPLWLEFQAAVDLEGGVGVFIRPGDVQLKTALAASGAAGLLASGRLGLGIRYGNPTGGVPTTLLSLPGGSRVEVQQLYARGGGEVQTTGAVEGFVEVGVVGGHIVITMSEADGFLADLIPDGIEAHFDLMIGYSPERGIYFQGSGSLEVTIAINLELGPISLDALHLVLGFSSANHSTGALTLEASLDASGEIGPVAASMERIGVKGTLNLQPGNLGPVDLALAFKPPNGLGLAIDAGPVSGGGFISFDADTGRYTGVLSLEVYAFSITAIGLLDTRLPGGQPGYSFLIIISVEFTPIQLGYGFTLNGVGGLAGINRTMVTDALQAGLRHHTIDHILFPHDPIHNAPAIISDLQTVFPPAMGRYVFGPMVKIGWETFITLELGILLEVPEPIRVVLLGQLNAVFPDAHAAVIDLHLDVLGILDVDQKLFSLDATIHDSRIAIFPVVGDMATRLTWGDNATFLMSVGGFNPVFHAPPAFPTLRRLQISFGDGGNPRVSMACYFALTSNTLQFGALAELLVTAGSFSVHGWMGFDALLTFSPFGLLAGLSAGMELKNGDTVLAGIHVTANISGPGPWRVWGDAAVSLYLFDVSVQFDSTFGPPAAQPPAPRLDAWEALRPALEDPRSWTPELPPAAVQVATLVAAQTAGQAPPVLLDPLGGASVRQRTVPLDKTLALFGNAPPLGVSEFHIDRVTVGSQVLSWTAVQGQFAPAQFERLSDAERLSRPSFELMDAGISFGDGALALGPAVAAELSYDTVMITATSSRPETAFVLPLDQQLAALRGGAAARSPLRSSGPRKFAPPPGSASLVSLAAESFVVTSTDDLSVRADLTGPTTKTAALEALARHLTTNPRDRGRLQVMPSAELLSA
ncbi:MAG TPA: DUF6603 domain-containing protein [Kofleriaceae bacterium]|nr:DUF6603 domain-containing protein [Kofleriaceae bacterium]